MLLILELNQWSACVSVEGGRDTLQYHNLVERHFNSIGGNPLMSINGEILCCLSFFLALDMLVLSYRMIVNVYRKVAENCRVGFSNRTGIIMLRA